MRKKRIVALILAIVMIIALPVGVYFYPSLFNNGGNNNGGNNNNGNGGNGNGNNNQSPITQITNIIHKGILSLPIRKKPTPYLFIYSINSYYNIKLYICQV